MSRQPKFRAWDKERKEWQYFNLSQLMQGSTSLIWTKLENWCEWTGLKDKNGKEIYEGDIVIKQTKNDGGGKPIDNGRILGTFVVRWSNNNCGFDINNTGGHGYEVIGNIYENPELLEEEK